MAKVFIALMRHGSYVQPEGVPSAHLPYGLDAAGCEQAAAAAGLLLNLCCERGWRLHPVLDCSTLRRAWETASLVASTLAQAQPDVGWTVEEFPALCERGLGAGANLTVEAIETIVADDPRWASLPADWKSSAHVRLPLQGAESMMEAGRRVATHVRARVAELETSSTPVLKLLVGHGGSIRHAAVELGVLSLDTVGDLSMHHCEPVVLSCQGAQWRHVAGQWKLRGGRDARLD